MESNYLFNKNFFLLLKAGKLSHWFLWLIHGGRKVIFFIVFFFRTTFVFSQQNGMEPRPELERLLEDYFSDDETKNMEQLLNELQTIREHPLNINQAGETALVALPFLNPVQIRALLDYREKYGNILSVYELASIPGFDEQLARLTGFFVLFDQAKFVRERSGYARHEVLVRAGRLTEKQAAFKDPKKYEGSPDRLYLRYRYTSSSLDAGFTGEKDPGESFFRASNKEGFDFYSGFARISSGSGKWTVLLGDYVVQFGQGLVAWQGFSPGKSAESSRIGNFSQGVKPHTSSDENNFMRGAAVTLNTGRFYITPFFSSSHLDANISTVDEHQVFTSFQTSGYHRTNSEIEDKNSVSALTAGGNVRYEGDRISLGLTGVHVNYPYPLVREDVPCNQFLFDGNKVTDLSLDFRYGVNRMYVFGEMATDLQQGMAALTGVLFQPFDQIELSSVYRNIGKRYSSPLASAFSESSRVNDETGFYLGTRILPVAKISLNMYLDFFRFNHIKYTTAAAGSGREFLFQANYEAGKDWRLSGRYFYECKPVKVSGPYSKRNIDQVRQSIRINLTGEAAPCMTVKSRFEQSFYRHDHRSYGFFICQDVGYHPEKFPANVWCRVAYFKTGDYDARIYAYENDLLYQFSVPALYGEGIRSYLTGKVKICEKVACWYKFSRTWFFGVQSIGSGNSLIEGNKRTEVKFQIRFRI